MTKRQIKKIAKVYAAVSIDNALGTWDGDGMTCEEAEFFTECIHKISLDISKGMPRSIYKLGTIHQIVKFVTDGDSTAT